MGVVYYAYMKIRNINKEHRENLGIQEKVALFITKGVGTMWCAYLFTIIAFIDLPEAIRSGQSAVISWITQTFLQLVLLSIIMVGQNILGKHAELRADAEYEVNLQNEKDIQEIKRSLEEIRKILKKE